MVAKKTDKSNLENKKLLFLEIGLMLSLSLALCAFEWSATEETDTYWEMPETVFEPELQAEITRPEVEQKQPRYALPEIKIVEDIIDIPEEDLNFISDVPEDWSFKIPDLDPEENVDDSIFYIVERWPVYEKGGPENFRRYIQQIVEYPQAAIEAGIDGKVFVQFVVNAEGYVSDIRIQQGRHPALDNAVIEAVSKSKRWEPGEQRGRPVKVAMTIPVIFRLQ